MSENSDQQSCTSEITLNTVKREESINEKFQNVFIDKMEIRKGGKEVKENEFNQIKQQQE